MLVLRQIKAYRKKKSDGPRIGAQLPDVPMQQAYFASPDPWQNV